MHGITIKDQDNRGFLTVDIHDLLCALDNRVQLSEWHAHFVECFGPTANQLLDVSDSGSRIDGTALVQMTSGVTQTIDGILEAYEPCGTTPWLIIRAIDGTCFDVITSDAHVIALLKQTFRNIDNLPDDAF